MKLAKYIITFLSMILFGLIIWYNHHLMGANQDLKERIANIEKHYLRKHGGTKLCGDGGEEEFVYYDLRSFDGGKIWYACEINDDWELTILGKAENIYPGLIKSIDETQKELDSLLSEKVD